MFRREFLSRSAAVAAVSALLRSQLAAAEGGMGKVRHSVCKWCYKGIPLETLCQAAKEIGLESIELLDPADFPVVKAHGLHCAMVSFPERLESLGTPRPAGPSV